MHQDRDISCISNDIDSRPGGESPFVSYIDIIDSDLHFRASRHSGAIRKGIEASGVQIQEIILHPADIVSGRSPGRFPAARLIHRVPRPRSGGFWHQDVYARAWRNAELGTRANKETSSHSLQDVSAASFRFAEQTRTASRRYPRTGLRRARRVDLSG